MYWKARRFVRLGSLQDDELFPELETGLTLVARNASRLADASALLAEQGQGRPARILAAHAEEESGKFLMLLDAARCPRGKLQAHLKRVPQHLARLLYAETAKLSPATFRELVDYIDHERRSHYLDGPEGVDWLFRNSMLYWREQAIYVDYVEQEGGVFAWQDPDRFEDPPGHQEVAISPPTFATELVSALVEARLHCSPALSIVATRWRPFEPRDDTHISEVQELIGFTLTELKKQDLLAGDQAALQRIWHYWTFPLWAVDLSEEDVGKQLIQVRDASSE